MTETLLDLSICAGRGPQKFLPCENDVKKHDLNNQPVLWPLLFMVLLKRECLKAVLSPKEPMWQEVMACSMFNVTWTLCVFAHFALTWRLCSLWWLVVVNCFTLNHPHGSCVAFFKKRNESVGWNHHSINYFKVCKEQSPSNCFCICPGDVFWIVFSYSVRTFCSIWKHFPVSWNLFQWSWNWQQDLLSCLVVVCKGSLR